MSYTFIAEEDAKAVFLLCGLFPDDSNIPIEDLTRYAWGLKLLKKVCTLGDARDRTKACVLNLKSANLLLDSDHSECVKMHDLVLAFVVAEVSKGDHPWIINHGDFLNLSRAEIIRESCKTVSLTCMGMREFPRDFNYPNVSLLRIANGDESIKSLTFPEDFYEKLKKLQVMACEKLQCPLLPRSLQCSTKLQTLCLHQCSLMSDCSPIGEYLLNLEVLSFAHSRISYLPSAIGNLVKLKLLVLTGCMNLYIDEGVLKNLVKLEELYMTVADEKGVRFTDINYKELEERSKNLSALEIEFFETDQKTKNMSYNKLERFKISMGRFLETNKGKDMHSSENTLMFVTNKDELLESGMNELFSKTEVLHLKAGGMNNLEEVLPKSVPRHSFYNLRVLCVSGCADLRYLFTVPVASGLVNLEDLKISECDVMEALVYSENGKEGAIRFEGLKHLSLYDLPMLVVLSNTNDVIDLPQLVELELRGLPNFTSVYPEYKSATSIMSSSSSSSAVKPFFNKKVMIPKLAILKIYGMDSLKNIWPCGSEVDVCLLREIKMENCRNLVNMFPSNLMPLLHHLETSDVGSCGSIEEVLVNIDVGNRDYCEEVLTKSVPRHSLYNLRDLCVSRCDNLRYLFTVPLASGLVKLEDLKIGKCPVLETLVCSENGEKRDIRFQELKDLYLYDLPMLVGFSNTNDVIDLPQLVKLQLEDLPNITSIYPEYKSATSVMSSSSFGVKPFFKKVMIPKLEILRIVWMNALKNIWPYGSDVELDDCLLRRISVGACHNLVYMFPSNWMPLLHHLETVDVKYCNNLEEVLLKSVSGHSFYNLRVLHVSTCYDLRYLFTVPVVSGLVKLERLTIRNCPVMEALVYNENGEEGAIRFQELKYLSLDELPMLAGFSNTNDVVNLPQLVELELRRLPSFTSIYPEYKSATSITSSSSSAVKPFFNKKVMIPRLEILQIHRMEALKNIWPCGSSEEVDACLLREIRVCACGKLVNMFPSNPMPLLHHLETIDVGFCDSLEVLFDIDVGFLCEIKGGSKLRSIIVFSSRELREVWRLKGIINPDLIIYGFQAVERIEIVGCKSFRNIITPTTARLDLGALRDMKTYGTDYRIDSIHYTNSEEENNVLVKSNQETSYDCENPKESESPRFQAILRVTSAPRKRYPDIKSFSHELNSEGVRPYPFWMPRGSSNLERVLVTVRAKFEKAKEEVDIDLHLFAADLVEILDKNSERHPEWQETLEDLLILARLCVMTSPAKFWLDCEDMFQELADRCQECPMGILKQFHIRMLFILTRCTRLIQFFKESDCRKMKLNSFQTLKTSGFC